MTSKNLSVFCSLFFVLVALFLLVNSNLKGIPLSIDFFFLYHPNNHLISETLQRGVLPLWNPYLHCGAPLLANLREGIFYPFSMLFRFFDITDGYRIFLALHYGLAGLYGYLLLQFFGAGRITAFLVAVILGFNGFFFLHSSYYNNFAGICWLPLTLIFLRSRSLPPGTQFVLLGITWSLLFFSGHPFFLYAALIFGLCCELFGFLRMRQLAVEKAALIFQRWLFAGLIFLALAAVQLFPFYESSKISSRAQGMAFADSMVFSQLPGQMAKFLFLPLWSWFSPETTGDPNIVGFYVGVAVLILALLGLNAKAEKNRWFWAAVFAGAILISLGASLPGYKIFWTYFPGLKFFRFPAQWLYLAAFALALLAAYGFISIRAHSLKIWALVLVSAELFLFAYRNPFGIAGKAAFRLSFTETNRFLQGQSAVRLSHIKENFGLGKDHLETGSDWIYSRSALLPNHSVPYHIATTHGYSVSESIWKATLFALLAESPGGFRLWNKIAAATEEMIYRPKPERAKPSQIALTSLPRAGKFSSARTFASETLLLKEMEQLRLRAETEILVLDPDRSISESPPTRAAAVGALPFSHYSENKIAIALEPPSSAEPGWLYLADSFYPGWEVYVDGKVSRIRPANFAFRAVSLTGAEKSVIFIYRPLSFTIGALTSSCAILILCGCFILTPRKPSCSYSLS